MHLIGECWVGGCKFCYGWTIFRRFLSQVGKFILPHQSIPPGGNSAAISASWHVTWWSAPKKIPGLIHFYFGLPGDTVFLKVVFLYDKYVHYSDKPPPSDRIAWRVSDVFREKCDNFLVEADNFYHFRGLILCNSKHIQFNWYKDKILVAQFSKYSIKLRCNFFLVYWLVGFICVAQKVSHYDGCIVIFDGYWMKNIFTKISSCITALHLEKIWRAHYSYWKLCSCMGIITNLHFYKDKYFVNYFEKTIESIIIFMTFWIDAQCSWH